MTRDELIAALQAGESCQWFDADDYWVAACEGEAGNLWCFDDGGPFENRMKHCPYCGRPIVVVEPAPVDEDDDDDN